MLLDDFLDFERHGSKIAFVEQGPYRAQSCTYREVARGIEAASDWLHEQGVTAGDRVVLWAENSAQWAMMFYACVKTRAVAVPIDVSFSEDFVEKIRQITRARCVWRASGKSRRFDVSAAPPPSGLLEIIYTSGTTGEPKGVMITHANLLSNLEPVYEEVQKYRKYAFPVSPLGFVHLIPLSHLFGQIMGLFIPQMLGGKVIFAEPSPSNVIRAVKRNRASVVICVPHELALLRTYVAGRHRSAADPPAGTGGIPGIVRSWWRHRHVHREFGWKFWAFVSGGAALPQAEEEFWSRLGYAVLQGYGLTETAPSVTITHPFKGLKRGTVGQKLPGLEVQIAEDGEILVRGPNVSPGYYGDERATAEVFRDGWLHTGDLGTFDQDGRLTILGRKKEVIVAANGLNIYPQDVESVLEQDTRVKEAAVVPGADHQRPEVHAVLVLRDAASDAAEVVRVANGRLEAHQRIQSFSVWPEDHFPRTSTGKLMRVAIARGVPASAMTDRRPEDLLERILSGARGGERLDEDLGLSSLDRVELMVNLEQRTGMAMDDSALAQARTLGDVAELIRGGTAAPEAPCTVRHWPSRYVTELLRIAVWYTLVFPAMALRMKVRAAGLESLRSLPLPVLFVANHQSIIDVPVILKTLPHALRRRLAPAMGTGRKPWEMLLSALFFHAYPLPGTSAGLREAIQHTGDLADRGYCPLVFPEGARTPDGRLLPFRPGIGVIAKQTRLPIVPVRIEGAYEIWPIHARGPAKGAVTVTFGPLMHLADREPSAIVAALEAWYRE